MKKETLEDFTKEVLQDEFFTNMAEYGKAERLIEIGAKWQQEQDKNKYSEQDILDINNWYLETFLDDALGLNGNDAEQKVKHLSGKGLTKEVLDYWFEQIKKK
jgi:hypothetical protein